MPTTAPPKGMTRRQPLADGSILTLNTDSAADVYFDARQRLVRLRYGEIAIRTARDESQRPFLVQTRDGNLTALGTEFTVRQFADETRLAVQQHAVEVRLAHGQIQRVEAGESLRFSAGAFSPIRTLSAGEDSWTQGVLSFRDRPLGEVIATLSAIVPAFCAATPRCRFTPQRRLSAERYRADFADYYANAAGKTAVCHPLLGHRRTRLRKKYKNSHSPLSLFPARST